MQKKKKTLRAKNGHFVQLSDPSRQYDENLVKKPVFVHLRIFKCLSCVSPTQGKMPITRGVEATYALETKE